MATLVRPVAPAVHPAARPAAGPVCIVGAGSSGLAAARHFRRQGIAFECLERSAEIGGNWRFGQPQSRVYHSTRMVSSKRLTEYNDFPMPDHYPDQPGHELVWHYLRSYAEHFDLLPYIECGVGVRHLTPAPGQGWSVILDNGQRRRYRGVVIANGHNWQPRWPALAGRFDGRLIHSGEYRSPETLAGRRVLVIGGGNSGFDLAAESARCAEATFHSLRRQYQVLPRFLHGQPIDTCGRWMLHWRLPLWLRRWAAARACRQAGTAPQWPQSLAADHQFLETHPVINSNWPPAVEAGRISLKPGIRQLEGDAVRFDDGSRAEVDLIVAATGYRISFPFLPTDRLNWYDGRPNLFLHVFHPDRDDLFVVGMIQPDSGQFGLVDCQAELIARYLAGLAAHRPAASDLQSVKRSGRSSAGGAIRYLDTPRHRLEVEHYGYRRELQRWIRRLSRP